MEKGLWRLTPAFDLNPFPDKERESKTWLSEQDKPVSDVQTLLVRCAYFSLTEAAALAALAEVVTAVAAWREVTLDPVVRLSPHELDDFAPAFEHEQMATARGLLK